MFQIQITAPASKDIRLIIEYIKTTLQNPSAAENHLNKIEESIHALKDMPFKYAKASDAYLSKKGIRCFTVKNYCIFYKVYEKDNTIMIIRVLFARRNWQDLLKEDQQEPTTNEA